MICVGCFVPSFQISSVQNVSVKYLTVRFTPLTTLIQSIYEVCNEELAIGTATRLMIEEEADVFEGTRLETAFFSGVRKFYREAVRKVLDKFPFRDETINDLIPGTE